MGIGLFWLIFGASLRALMFSSGWHEVLVDRVEISTPINSWKRVVEGVYLHGMSRSAYDGDLFHETPIALEFYSVLINFDVAVIRAFFIFTDVVTALVMAKVAQVYFRSMVKDQESKKKTCPPDAAKLLLSFEDSFSVASNVIAVYMLNPYVIINCVAMTTTVHSNLLLAILLLAIGVKSTFTACILLALAAYQSFYPLMLLLPVVLTTLENRSIKLTLASVVTSVSCLLLLLWISHELTGSWSFLNATYGCILKVPDLTPNIGLFWYFFTEMFDHFYVFFTYVFQLNPFVYVIPLGLRFSNNIPLLNFALCAIMAIFKSYPSVGDVGFYLSFLPLWRHLTPFFRHSFIVGIIMLVTFVLSPILWHLWIYSESANANFFFATTLAFATAQIFLLTDVLFAQAKYDYHLRHGMDLKINGKEAQLVLE